MVTVTHPVVRALVEAVNSGDRAAFMDLLTDHVIVTDEGSERVPDQWFDQEIFTSNGHMDVREQDAGGLDLLIRYRNDTWGTLNTRWHFEVTGDRISRIDAAQA